MQFYPVSSENSEYPNFLDKNDATFATFQTALDNVFKNLRVGSKARHTESISVEEENRLWDSGVINTRTPLGLLRAIIYYNVC